MLLFLNLQTTSRTTVSVHVILWESWLNKDLFVGIGIFIYFYVFLTDCETNDWKQRNKCKSKNNLNKNEKKHCKDETKTESERGSVGRVRQIDEEKLTYYQNNYEAAKINVRRMQNQSQGI